ncbi:hypothetical protein BCR32DRAFT_326525 [Anaeromyces robustus]|uniref:CBM21 domain-containing protein n=1 Tax=Anaeromyces robustus TaxID=1754192 RepID=A0A1Y1XCJ2_9FUNG|nr:hypothetical protein BCR32DRAFT_326525 [Anaeromyces robustus]|eukprot:ORX83094.1 hypothetical protein BCR32DRAFT_326525 [Anaeromyces robustus]
MDVQQNSISLQMSSPKHMNIKVNSNVMPFTCESPKSPKSLKHTPTKAYFANTYQMLSSSPNALNKMNMNSYSISPVKKNNPLVKLMDSETVQNTKWNNYNANNNIKSNTKSDYKDVLNNINNINKNINNSETNIKEKIINTKCNIFNNNINEANKFTDKNFNYNNNNNNTNINSNTNTNMNCNHSPSFDNSFIDIKAIKNNCPVQPNHTQEQSDFFVKKSIKNLFENKTNDKNLSQLSYQLSKVAKNNNYGHDYEKGELNENKKLSKSSNNYNKSLETEKIADIVFKKQEVYEAEKMHVNAKTEEKIELKKSLYSCQLSLSPKEKMMFDSRNHHLVPSMNFNKKSSLTREDFESTKVIKENARKMLLANNEPHKSVTRKSKSVKFSGENEECPFKRFEAPLSVTTSPIFLVNSTIKPFLETRCNLTTFSEFKQRMIIKKPIVIEKAGLLIEEREKTNGRLASFIKNADIKKEHGVFKTRPSHVPYGPSSTASPLFSTLEKDKIRVVIQVQNLAYQKEVCVRYTFNNWLTSKDVSATYLNSLNVTSYISKKFHESTCINSNASNQERNTTGIDDSESKIISKSVDRFVADIEIPSYIMDFMDYDNNFLNNSRNFNLSGDDNDDDLLSKDKRRYSQSLGEEWDNDIINKCTLKFAAFYRVNGEEYWENNNHLNYTIDISRVLYIPTKKVYLRSRAPEAIKSKMVNFTDSFYNLSRSKKEFELKSILKSENSNMMDNKNTTNLNNNTPYHKNIIDHQSIESKVLAKIELREKCIRETIQKELSGTSFCKQIGINPTILNTIINSNRVSTRNNILKMIIYYQRKAGITNPIIPLEKETSLIEEKN